MDKKTFKEIGSRDGDWTKFLPSNWSKDSFESYYDENDFVAAAIVAQAHAISYSLGGDFEDVTPEFEFDDETGQCGYDVFPDGSLRFWNNAEDEVWSDAGDFADQLVDTILLCRDGNEDTFGVLNDMDRKFLTHVLGQEHAKNRLNREEV